MIVESIELIDVGDAEYPSEGLFKLFGEVGSDIAGLFDVVRDTGLGTEELFIDCFCLLYTSDAADE